MSVRIHPWVWQLLGEYAAYLDETAAEETSADKAAEGILGRALLADEKFQGWFAAKITEDIEAWEDEYVREG